ncbi:hypothetical protein [Phytoactinopolyspora limicola]|uniref:hypothetical protein n=1 Tax=Phytoactinopolyspora limicola TaxID=2715536 RepID=UPI00140E4406|nr:hypothetical protein [Phytoactinopolyspora limicola]
MTIDTPGEPDPVPGTAAVEPATSEPTPAERSAGANRWRTAVSAVLLVLGCSLLVPAAVAGWLRWVVTDTDNYVDTVSPLADDPAIQAAVADRVAERISDHIDAAAVVDRAARTLEDERGRTSMAASLDALATPIDEMTTSWIAERTNDVLGTDAFQEVWSTAHRAAHRALVEIVTGRGDVPGLVADDESVVIDLAPLVELVRDHLVENGFELAERIPSTETEFVLFQSPDLPAARDTLRTLDSLGFVLPIVAVVLIVAGVAVAQRRRFALAAAGAGITVAMVATAVGLLLLRGRSLDQLPGTVDRDASAAMFDQLTTTLSTGVYIALAAGVLVILAALLVVPGRRS